MADRIQLRRDTKANWEQYNPILLEGEPGHVLDDPNLYKMGDGVHAWNDLPYRGYNGTVVNTKGNSENAVMSQKAVTYELDKIALLNEIVVDSAIQAYININTGVITPKAVGQDTYRLVKVYLKAGIYYVHTTKAGTQAGCWKYTDNTFQTPETMIWGNVAKDGMVEFTDGYYAIAWSSSANDTNYVTAFPVVCIKDGFEYGAITNAPDWTNLVLGTKIVGKSDFTDGGYITTDGRVLPNPDWEYTENYYKVTPGSILVLENMLNSSGGANVTFYNKYKTNLTGFAIQYDDFNPYHRHYVRVVSNAVYARFSRLKDASSMPCVYSIGNEATSTRTPLIINENVEYYKYITEEGIIGDADSTYSLAKIFIEKPGFYYLKASNYHPVLIKANNADYISDNLIILGSGNYDTILWLDAGFYALCWGGRNTNTQKSNVYSENNEPIVFEYAFNLNEGDKDQILKSGIFNNLINVNNTIVSRYIKDNTGEIANASYDYRLSKIHIMYAGKYWIRSRSAGHPTMWEYDSNNYLNPIRQILGVGSVDTIIELTEGYYAICWTVWKEGEGGGNIPYQWLDLSNQFIYRIDDLLNVVENNIIFPEKNQLNRINFSSLGNDDLTIEGSSTRNNGIITLAAGVANRAYLAGGLECAHWEMSAKFKCTGSVSFVMGKDGSSFGAWIELLIDNGVSKYIFYNNGEGGQYSHAYEGELGFTLNEGEEYLLRLFFNVTTTKVLGFEIFGQFNEYFTYTFTDVVCNGYGRPFFYSKTSCVVKHSAISVQNYYDIKTAKAGVWGHSYVEGDSLGADRDKTFTNLLANAIGATKVFNFGLGGDIWQGVYEKLSNEMGFASNIQYALICCGANDSGMSLADAQTKINQIATKLQQNKITPIFFTISPTGTGSWYKQNWVDTNAWIRANFKYVDMEQVFLDVDATGEWNESNVRKNLYLGDNVHPSVQGHAEIFKRIQMDCPYLF